MERNWAHCDECPDWDAGCLDMSDAEERDRKRDEIVMRKREWFGAKMVDYALAVAEEGPDPCTDDCYRLRGSDGVAHTACLVCLKKHHDIASLRYCEVCGFFVEKADFGDGSCRWCRELGPDRSRALAGKPDRAPKKKIGLDNRYERLVAALDTDDWRPAFARYLQEEDSDNLDLLEPLGLEGLFQRLGINYWHYSGYGQALFFIAQREWERFEGDSALLDILRNINSPDPADRLEYCLRTGTCARIMTRAINEMVDPAARRLLEAVRSGERPDPWEFIRKACPRVPRALLYVYMLDNGIALETRKALEKEGASVEDSVLAGLGKEPGLALPVFAWGYFHKIDRHNRSAPAYWWTLVVDVICRLFGITVPEAIQLSEAYSEGGQAGARLPATLKSILAGIPAPPVEDAKALAAFQKLPGWWSRFALLLARQRVECRLRTEDIPFLLEMLTNIPEQTKHIDHYVSEIRKAAGMEDDEPPSTPTDLLREHIKRTGPIKTRLALYKEDLRYWWGWVNFIYNGYLELLIQSGQLDELEKYLDGEYGRGQDRLEEELRKKRKPDADHWMSWPPSQPVVEDRIFMAYIDGVLGRPERMRRHLSELGAYLERKAVKCRAAGLAVVRHEELAQNIRELENGLADDPGPIIGFLERFESGRGPMSRRRWHERDESSEEAFHFDLGPEAWRTLRVVMTAFKEKRKTGRKR